MGVKRVDRRVQRTRQQLTIALISLIQEKGFEALTVQDVIDRANVGRATFYAHFENKEDLLVSGLEDFRQGIREHQRRLLQQATGPDETAFLFTRELFVHVAGHRDVFSAMIGKHSGTVVQRLIQKIVMDLVREELKALSPRAEERSLSHETTVQFIAGALWGLLSWWVDAKRSLSAEDMETAFRRMPMPAIKAAHSHS